MMKGIKKPPEYQNATEQRDKKRIAGSAIVIAAIVFVVCFGLITLWRSNEHRKETLELTRRYMVFESRVEHLIHTRVALFKGFEAYLDVNPEPELEEVYAYLESLVGEDLELIRNVGFFEDTTIRWNYPLEFNKETVGIDMSAIGEQGEAVNRVKEELQPLMLGPLRLIQGGSGIIARLPLLTKEGEYLGQIAVVFRTGVVIAHLRAYAKELGLELEVYDCPYAEKPFYQTHEFQERTHHIEFIIDPELINWRTRVAHRHSGIQSVHLVALICALMLAAGVGFFIAKYMKKNDELREMSIRDFLTGLYNRHFLDEYQVLTLATVKREKRKAALILLDLDNFKRINDLYGHLTGDRVLAKTAHILSKFTRTGESVFRIGGDEFLIFLPVIADDTEVEAVKNRLRRACCKEFPSAEFPFELTFSLGSAVFPTDGEDFETLIEVADKRLYADK